MARIVQSKQSPLAVWLPRLFTLLAFSLALGFLWHTSPQRVLFGKYNLGYAVFLCLLFFVVIPGLHFMARFCAARHELPLKSGRRLTIGPRQKLTALALAGGVFYFTSSALLTRMVGARALGFNANVFHPYLQNVPVPGDARQHVNRWGFRGDDIEREKDVRTFRLFFFGGSTVYCGTVPYEQTHCRVLQRRLQAAYPQYRIEVQNLGAEWHSTEHDTIKLLFYAQDFSPDLVMTFHGINDLVRSFSPDMFGEGPYWPDYRHYYGATANLATHGGKLPLLVRAAAGHWCSDWRFDQMRLEGPEGNGLYGMRTLFYPKAQEVEITEFKSLPAFNRNLRDFVDIARGKSMEVVLATQPSLYRDDLTATERELLGFPLSHHFNGQRASLHSMVLGMRQFNEATRRIAREKHIELIDLERRMPKTTAYLYDDVHYTRAGNELIGNAIADQMISARLIDRIMRRREVKTSPLPQVGPRPAIALGGG